MTMRAIGLSALLLAACSHLRSGRPVTLPDGQSAYVVECNGDDVATCFERASRTCKPYHVVSVYRGGQQTEMHCLGGGVGNNRVFGGLEKCSTGTDQGDIQMFFECSRSDVASQPQPEGAPAADAKPAACVASADCPEGFECWPSEHVCKPR